MTSTLKSKPLPGKLEDLIRYKTPVTITGRKEYDAVLEIIDRLMQIPRLTKGQGTYLQTLVDLVHCYEEKHEQMRTSDLTALDILKTLMEEHEMNASDLARLLGTHVSLGSKILKGDRALTLEHIKLLGEYFHVSPVIFVN
jgi:HTH-type transcriptional regulator/antitoxin HigA